MKLLNLGCGYPRLEGEEWVNLDTLRSQLPAGSVELANLNAEQNYIEHDITTPLPFDGDTFDGVLASHVFEHFDCQQAVRIMAECKRVLKIGGVLLVSVPNASYFRKVYHEDRNRNWKRLFDVEDEPNPIPTFFEAALWFDQHKAIITEDALWCYLKHAGFPYPFALFSEGSHEGPLQAMIEYLNRRKFSLEMAAVKDPLNKNNS